MIRSIIRDLQRNLYRDSAFSFRHARSNLPTNVSQLRSPPIDRGAIVRRETRGDDHGSAIATPIFAEIAIPPRSPSVGGEDSVEQRAGYASRRGGSDDTSSSSPLSSSSPSERARNRYYAGYSRDATVSAQRPGPQNARDARRVARTRPRAPLAFATACSCGASQPPPGRCARAASRHTSTPDPYRFFVFEVGLGEIRRGGKRERERPRRKRANARVPSAASTHRGHKGLRLKLNSFQEIPHDARALTDVCARNRFINYTHTGCFQLTI